MRDALLAVLCLILAVAPGGCSRSGPVAVGGEVFVGRAVTGVAVRLVDASGRVRESTPTDAHGEFQFPPADVTGPLLLAAPATDVDGSPVFVAAVVAPEELAPGAASTRINLNPLGTLLVGRLLGGPLTHAPDAATLAQVRGDSAHIASERRALSQLLAPLAEAARLPVGALDDLGMHAAAGGAADAVHRFIALARIHLTTGALAIGAQRAAIAAASVRSTATPIDHVIVVIGENQTFDSVFATYAPQSGRIWNLRSQGIVRADGLPGAEFARATQQRAVPQSRYTLDPPRAGAYAHLPQPTLIGVVDLRNRLVGNGPDIRFPTDLPPGPFQVTRYVKWPSVASPPTLASAMANLGAATGDPMHRFFQMWQQTGGDNARLDLYTWVTVTAGMGGDTSGVTPANTGQGGELMGFANMATGDAPVFLDLATHYAISDNYHQSVMGGTGANFYEIATADLPFYVQNGAAAAPPPNQIEDPDPAPGTANFYKRDGYEGGAYVECADARQPGVAPILALLERHHLKSGCEPGHHYLVNNYGPGYDLDGHPQPLGPHNYNYPPQTTPTIAAALAARGISWSWYSGGRDAADLKEEMRGGRMNLAAARRLQYNFTGDPLAGSTAIMSTPQLRSQLKGLASFHAELAAHTLPAVAFVVPKNLDSGHPGYSQQTSLEAFLAGIVAAVKAQPEIWAHTAIIATTDEGGGHFDSGYIQTLDFFGDGTRVPLIVISPYARAGYVDHVYNDHASILKFIERNWGLEPLSARSRDNLADPVALPESPYRPINGPAVGDLMTLFDF